MARFGLPRGAKNHPYLRYIATIYKPDEAKVLLGIPADRTLSVALSFGYPATDWVSVKMGGHKPLDEVVRCEKWE